MNKIIKITMSDWVIRQLDYMAEKTGMSRSCVLAMLVSTAFITWQNHGRVEEDYYKMHALKASEVVITE